MLLHAIAKYSVAKDTINNSQKKKRGRPKLVTPEAQQSEKTHIVICSKCISKIGKGYAHDCSRCGKVANVESLLVNTPMTSHHAEWSTSYT